MALPVVRPSPKPQAWSQGPGLREWSLCTTDLRRATHARTRNPRLERASSSPPSIISDVSIAFKTGEANIKIRSCADTSPSELSKITLCEVVKSLMDSHKSHVSAKEEQGRFSDAPPRLRLTSPHRSCTSSFADGIQEQAKQRNAHHMQP